MRRLFVLILIIPVLTFLGCSEDHKQTAEVSSKEEETPEANLKNLMSRLQSHVLEGRDEIAIEYARDLFPGQQTLAMACASEQNEEDYRLISKWIESTKPRNPKNYLRIYPFRPWQSEIIVTSMTGSELAEVSGKPDGFHEEAVRLARAGILRAEQRFYSVDFRHRGDAVGQRYEIFVWDPGRKAWKMLGPIWRALSRAGEN